MGGSDVSELGALIHQGLEAVLSPRLVGESLHNMLKLAAYLLSVRQESAVRQCTLIRQAAMGSCAG